MGKDIISCAHLWSSRHWKSICYAIGSVSLCVRCHDALCEWSFLFDAWVSPNAVDSITPNAALPISLIATLCILILSPEVDLLNFPENPEFPWNSWMWLSASCCSRHASMHCSPRADPWISLHFLKYAPSMLRNLVQFLEGCLCFHAWKLKRSESHRNWQRPFHVASVLTCIESVCRTCEPNSADPPN